MDARRILLVAHKTALEEPLLQVVRARIASGPVSFVFLVPATAPLAEGLTWEESEVWSAAEARMHEAVATLRTLGADVEGKVGNNDAHDAILDELRASPYNEVVVSTLPHAVSVWLGLDLPNRLRASTSVQVTHVIFDPTRPAPEDLDLTSDRPARA
ncbi:MAG: hypothetical protein V4850_33525 [Myxococcota bacterium]